MPLVDVAMLDATPAGEQPERSPRCAAAKANMSDELAAQLLANVLEAYRRKVTPGDTIGEPQGKA
jgi:hypothetical protein